MFRSHGEDVMRRAMAVVNVVNQTSTLVPRRARRRAVRGGSRTGFHHLRSGQLRHQSHVWICKRPPSIMVMLAVHVPLNILSHRIWLIYGRFGRLGFTAGSLGQNVHPALAAIS